MLPAAEVCDDAVDGDCDGLADADDRDCGAAPDDPAGCGCGASTPMTGILPFALMMLGLLLRRRRS